MILMHPTLKIHDLANIVGVSYLKLKSFFDVYFAEDEENIPHKRERAKNDTKYLVYYPNGALSRTRFISFQKQSPNKGQLREYSLAIPEEFYKLRVMSEECITPAQLNVVIEEVFSSKDFNLLQFYGDISHRYSEIPPLSLSLGAELVIHKLKKLAQDIYHEAKYRFGVKSEIEFMVSKEEFPSWRVRELLQQNILNFSSWEKSCFDYMIETIRQVVYDFWRVSVLEFYADRDGLMTKQSTWKKAHLDWAEEHLPVKYDFKIDYFSSVYKGFWYKVLSVSDFEEKGINWLSLMPLYLMGENPYNPSSARYFRMFSEEGDIPSEVLEGLKPDTYDCFKSNLTDYLKEI